MRKLPSLNGVKAFEAAARAGSFARAADELHVSPAAISRLVHLLEQRLGFALFERKANRLVPTEAGRTYQAGLTRLLDQLAALTAEVTGRAGARTLTVGVGPTFAMRWLIPHLADFQKRHSDIEVRFATGGVAAPFNDDWTCGIRLGDGDWPGLAAERLFAADLIPVCAPAIAKRLKTPADLKGETLLRVAHAGDDWPHWLDAFGLANIRIRGPEFEYYAQALQAAAEGVGVAIGMRPYVDDDLRTGRLVAPFRQSVPQGKQWFLLYKSSRETEPAFAAFRRWIVKTARKEAP